MLALLLKKPALPYPVIIFGTVYTVIIVGLLPCYFHWDANLYLGLMSLPYVCRVNMGQRSFRYVLPACISVLFAIYLPVNTLLFMALLFSILLMVESCIGKLNLAILFLVILISPIFTWIAHLAEFPVRLWLSQFVATVLQTAGITASAAGNQIQLADTEFSVDPACTGLNMLVTSLIICLFVLSFYQRRLNKQLPFGYLAALFSATIILNIACNFFRILLIVFFHIMPGTAMHDMIGIVCLLIYVILPLVQFTQPYVGRFGRVGAERLQNSHPESFRAEKWSDMVVSVRPANRSVIFLNILFLATISYISSHTISADSRIRSTSTVQMDGYKRTVLSGNIVKFENSTALIYVKPTAFYAPEHDPMVCWTGSGYQFQNIQTETISGTTVYTGILKKGHDKIYAGWWFDDGQIKTTSQFTWRWRAARGQSNFYLVNINTTTTQSLHAHIMKMLNQHLAF